MSDSGSHSIDVTDSEISAGGDVKFVGGGEYNIAGHIVNVEVRPPSSGTEIPALQNALLKNRVTLKRDLDKLEQLVRKGIRLKHGKITAVTKDIIISGKNIELLIPAIKLKGGDAESLPFEADIISRINVSIMRGQKHFKEKELTELLREEGVAQSRLDFAREFQWFRFPEQRKIDVEEAEENYESIASRRKYAQRFLEKCGEMMEYHDIGPDVAPETLTSSAKSEPKPSSAKSRPKLKGTMLKRKK